MRTLLAAAFLLLASFTSFAADDKKYTSKEGKFAAQFPAGAEVKEDKKAAGGGIEMRLFIVDKKDKAFIVMYMDLPDAAKNVEPKKILDGAETGAVNQSGGKLKSSKDFEFGKTNLPSREVLVDKEGNLIKSWVILNGTRVYVLAVGGPKEFATEKEGTAFLKSFEITK